MGNSLSSCCQLRPSRRRHSTSDSAAPCDRYLHPQLPLHQQHLQHQQQLQYLRQHQQQMLTGNGKWPPTGGPYDSSNSLMMTLQSPALMAAPQHQQASMIAIEHINDREPAEDTRDPSTNASVRPLFLRGLRQLCAARRSATGTTMPTALAMPSRASSSTSHLVSDDSTLWQPALKPAVRGLALAVFFHVRHRRSARPQRGRYLEIFDELLHPLQAGPEAAEAAAKEPDHRAVYRFVRTLFCAAQLTAECAVVSLVYLERLLAAAEIDLYPGNWRRCLLGSVLLASKVWDDQAVWNVDYCQILKDARIEDMNELERKYLELIQFNINVPAPVYARYYFELRSLLSAHGMGQPAGRLTRDRALCLGLIDASGRPSPSSSTSARPEPAGSGGQRSGGMVQQASTFASASGSAFGRPRRSLSSQQVHRAPAPFVLS